MGAVLHPFAGDMSLLKRQIEELNKARELCSDLRSQNDGYAGMLWELASNTNAAMGFEDPGSFQSALRDFADTNAGLIDAIDQACASSIEKYQQRYDEYEESYETWLAQQSSDS